MNFVIPPFCGQTKMFGGVVLLFLFARKTNVHMVFMVPVRHSNAYPCLVPNQRGRLPPWIFAPMSFVGQTVAGV